MLILGVAAGIGLFIAGWIVGVLHISGKAWLESVEQSQSYQRYIDQLEAQLKAEHRDA